MKLKTQIAVIALALGVSTSLVLSQESQPQQLPNAMNTIQGVWGVHRHGVNCNTGQDVSHFPALMTFHQDGTVLGQAYGPSPQNAYGPAEMGVWQSGPGNTFTFRILSYGYDNSGQRTNSVIVTASGQLTSASTFTYTSAIKFYDVNGNLLFTVCGRATATRFE
jgi:hypothetical protein